MNSTNKLFWLPRFEHDYKKLSKEDKEKVNKTLQISFTLEGNEIYLRTVGKHDIFKNP